MGEQRLDSIEGGIYRSVAGGPAVFDLAVDLQFQLGLRRPVLGAAEDLKRNQPHAVVGAHHLVVDQGDDVFVEDLLLFVRQVLEALERIAHGVVAQIVAQLLQLLLERMAARVLAQHQLRRRQPHRLRGHDLVGAGVLQHAVLMDAGLVGEGVGADDGLVGLHGEPGDRGNQP